MHKKTIYVLGLTILLFLVINAAQSHQQKAPIILKISTETLGQAKQHGYKYKFHVNKALQGHKKSLTSLLNFSSKTDAAGSLGHRCLIDALGEKLGRNIILQAIAALQQPKIKKYMQWYINGEPCF